MLLFSKKLSMVNAGGGYVRSRSLDLCIPNAKKEMTFSDLNLRNPFAVTASAYALVAACIIAIDSRVKIIFAVRSLSEVVPSIIPPFPVYVVNVLFGPSARHHQKNNPMKIVAFDAMLQRKADTSITTKIIGSSNAANGGSSRAPHPPSDDSSPWIVAKLRPYEFGRKVIAWAGATCSNSISHLTLLRSFWLGVESVTSTLSPRLSSTGG